MMGYLFEMMISNYDGIPIRDDDHFFFIRLAHDPAFYRCILIDGWRVQVIELKMSLAWNDGRITWAGTRKAAFKMVAHHLIKSKELFDEALTRFRAVETAGLVQIDGVVYSLAADGLIKELGEL